MVNLSEIPIVDIFKSLILDSLMKDEFIHKRQSPKGFFSRNKYWLAGTALVAGAALGPFALTGIAAAIGFGEAGIVAGSIAAWMMSLQGGAVAAGIGGFIAASTGGAYFGAAIAKAILMISESNSEEFAEMENFVSIYESDVDENDEEKNNLHKKMIFDMKQPLLDSNENEKLKSFLRGFDLARQVSQDRAKKFEFLVDREEEKCLEGPNFLHKHLIDTYGDDCREHLHVVEHSDSKILWFLSK
ncbi:10816_t:CDS:2 [Funneliformis mosseae]|uniref:10816_t:CDS:1 n=1 Tax=Funneliformis mosseae TaxID=27381 RepID=A0A9N9HST6_FUNMO|nr:10816_t:CDS:2 [Funneliformis mosseae]